MCKVLILNGCLPESEISKKLEIFKNNYKGEFKEVFLYQLNIKATESRDGMDVIYDSIITDNVDALLVACETELDKTLETAISRMKAKLVNSELENKIFGAILVGEDYNKDLVNIAFDLGMITNANCFASISDESEGSESEIKNVADNIYDLSAMITKTTHPVISDEHTDALQEEDPNEIGLDGDDFNVDNLGFSELSDENTEQEIDTYTEEGEETEDEDNSGIEEEEDEEETELEEGEEEDENENEEDEEAFESLKINLKSFSQFNK